MAFADGRHAVVTTDELLRAGFTPTAIQGLIARGVLHRIHHGVYAVGLPTLTGEGRALAAVLAVGKPVRGPHPTGTDAASAGRTGTTVQGLTSWWPRTPTVVAARAVRGPAGVQVVRTRSLEPADVTLVDGIPVLTETRLILDAAQAGDRKLLERCWRTAKRERRLDEGAIVARLAGRRGQALIAPLLSEDEPDTTNDFERTVYELIAGLGLGVLKREWPIGSYVLDFYLPDLRWCLEADGNHVHATPEQVRRDKDRDRELYARHSILTHRIAFWEPFPRVRGQLRAAAAQRAIEVTAVREWKRRATP